MMLELERLIMQAKALAGDNPCVLGHEWESLGGRRCPRFEAQENCSQTVYRCVKCEAFDYGEDGGPAHVECYQECPHEWKFETEVKR